MPRDDEELESHLAERLKETHDVANFTRKPRPEASGEVERVVELPGHLGGRKITDKFVRGGTPTPVPRPTDEDAPRSKGLDHHLKSRLAEVQDTPIGQMSELERQLQAYRKQRRDLGGS